MPLLFHRPADAAEVDRLLTSAPALRLLTVGDDGAPTIGFFHFIGDRSALEFHIRKENPQLAHLRARPAALEADEYLTPIPSHWVDRFDGSAFAGYYRMAILHGEAEILETPEAVADHFARFLKKHQPEGAYELPRSATAGGAHAVVRFTVRKLDARWQLGQHHPPELRRKLVDKLRTRGRAGDARAADEILGWLMAHPEGDGDPLKYE